MAWPHQLPGPWITVPVWLLTASIELPTNCEPLIAGALVSLASKPVRLRRKLEPVMTGAALPKVRKPNKLSVICRYLNDGLKPRTVSAASFCPPP